MIISEVDLEPMLIPHHKGRKRMHLGMSDSLSVSVSFLFFVEQYCCLMMNDNTYFSWFCRTKG